MGRLMLYTGGARSGKSRAAQERAMEWNDVAYIATAINTDGEMNERIRRHVQARPDAWKTYECPYDITGTIDETRHEAYLIDCITVYVTNLILKRRREWDEAEILSCKEQDAIESDIIAETDKLLEMMEGKEADFLVVTNEVGMGLVPQNALGRLFRDVAGRVNQRIAAAADEVYLSVSGIQVKIK